MKPSRALTLTLALLVVGGIGGGVWPSATAAVSSAEVTYSFKLKKGVGKTVLGDTFLFTGNGAMTANTGTGKFTYSIKLSNGLTFEGSGDVVQTTKDEVFGSATADSGSAMGTVIFTGKLKRGGKKFAGGKLYAVIPNLLGDAPGGFVFATAKLTGTLQ